MSPNIFGGSLLSPSTSQVCHKLREMHLLNHGNTDTTNTAFNAQLLPSQNISLVSLIVYNSQDNMVVWFYFCVKKIKKPSDVIY